MVDLTNIGCCGCFSFLKKPSVSVRQPLDADDILSKHLLEHQLPEDSDGSFYTGDDPGESFYNLDGSVYYGDDLDRSFYYGDDSDRRFNSRDDPDRIFYDKDDTDYLDGSDDGTPRKSYEDIIKLRIQNNFVCREIIVKETNKVFRSEDKSGNKMINQYVHLGKIGSGSYGKVVRYRSMKDGNLYAVKVLNKPYMMKVHVVQSETAMTDVLREYPFLGDTSPETYDKIVNDSVQIPGGTNPQLADLLQRLLCEDPGDRITLQAVAEHPWVVGYEGPVPEYICRCGFGRRKRKDFEEEGQ